MSLEQKTADKLQAILDVHGVIAVLFYFVENASTVLGAANTALTRGALAHTEALIANHGKPASQLFVLLGAIADGATLARVMCTSEGCPLDPAERLSIMKTLDEVGWRFQSAATTAAKAARRE